jgi:hypothetical protein
MGEILFAFVIALAMLYVLYVAGCPAADFATNVMSRWKSAWTGIKSAFYSPDKLKDALVRDGWQLYTAPWCGWSRDQLSELGGSFDGNIVCDDDGNCPDGVDSFPTWINANSGQVVPGYMPVTRLEKLVRL